MKIMESILNRRSIRKYKNRPVRSEDVMVILEAARLAPSGDNTQPWEFILIDDSVIKDKIVNNCNNQQWMIDAPLFIACVADLKARIKNSEKLVLWENSPQYELKQILRDTAISVEHLVLQAEFMGISTCWVADFKQENIRPVLNIPKDKYLVAIITLGYADEDPKSRPRKPLAQMVHYNTWGKKK